MPFKNKLELQSVKVIILIINGTDITFSFNQILALWYKYPIKRSSFMNIFNLIFLTFSTRYVHLLVAFCRRKNLTIRPRIELCLKLERKTIESLFHRLFRHIYIVFRINIHRKCGLLFKSQSRF